MSEWQPIETAPTGPQMIIIFGGRHAGVTISEADGDWWRWQKEKGLSTIPTHWMPLPEPPR